MKTILTLLFCACALTGCATDPGTGRRVYTGPAFTFGGSYATPGGATIGATIRLDPSFVRQKK